MKILPLHPELKEYLKSRQLEKKFEKQTKLDGLRLNRQALTKKQ